jgi:hypothetical protein
MLPQMLRAFRAERDFGHVKRHGGYLVTAVLTDKAAEDRKPQENKEAHGIRNHGYEYRT